MFMFCKKSSMPDSWTEDNNKFFFFFLLYALHHYLISKHTFSSKGHIIVEYWNTPWTSTHPPPPTHLLEKTLRCGGPDI